MVLPPTPRQRQVFVPNPRTVALSSTPFLSTLLHAVQLEMFRASVVATPQGGMAPMLREVEDDDDASKRHDLVR